MGGLGVEFAILRTRQRPVQMVMLVKFKTKQPSTKKAGRSPCVIDEGPAKNPLWKRQRNAQQDTKTLWSLAGVFRFSRAKELISKLGRFSYAFDAITDVKNSETKSDMLGNPFQTVIYSDFDKNQAGFLAFRQIFHYYSQTKKTCHIKANPPGQIRQSFWKVARITDGSVFLRQTTNPIIDEAVITFSRKKKRFSREKLRFWGTFLRTFFRRLSSNA